ncbi:hypothetical protein JCM10212_005857 [Sporobolomyces blumeae]
MASDRPSGGYGYGPAPATFGSARASQPPPRRPSPPSYPPPPPALDPRYHPPHYEDYRRRPDHARYDTLEQNVLNDVLAGLQPPPLPSSRQPYYPPQVNPEHAERASWPPPPRSAPIPPLARPPSTALPPIPPTTHPYSTFPIYPGAPPPHLASSSSASSSTATALARYPPDPLPRPKPQYAVHEYGYDYERPGHRQRAQDAHVELRRTRPEASLRASRGPPPPPAPGSRLSPRASTTTHRRTPSSSSTMTAASGVAAKAAAARLGVPLSPSRPTSSSSASSSVSKPVHQKASYQPPAMPTMSTMPSRPSNPPMPTQTKTTTNPSTDVPIRPSVAVEPSRPPPAPTPSVAPSISVGPVATVSTERKHPAPASPSSKEPESATVRPIEERTPSSQGRVDSLSTSTRVDLGSGGTFATHSSTGEEVEPRGQGRASPVRLERVPPVAERTQDEGSETNERKQDRDEDGSVDRGQEVRMEEEGEAQDDVRVGGDESRRDGGVDPERLTIGSEEDDEEDEDEDEDEFDVNSLRIAHKKEHQVDRVRDETGNVDVEAISSGEEEEVEDEDIDMSTDLLGTQPLDEEEDASDLDLERGDLGIGDRGKDRSAVVARGSFGFDLLDETDGEDEEAETDLSDLDHVEGGSRPGPKTVGALDDVRIEENKRKKKRRRVIGHVDPEGSVSGLDSEGPSRLSSLEPSLDEPPVALDSERRSGQSSEVDGRQVKPLPTRKSLFSFFSSSTPSTTADSASAPSGATQVDHPDRTSTPRDSTDPDLPAVAVSTPTPSSTTSSAPAPLHASVSASLLGRVLSSVVAPSSPSSLIDQTSTPSTPTSNVSPTKPSVEVRTEQRVPLEPSRNDAPLVVPASRDVCETGPGSVLESRLVSTPSTDPGNPAISTKATIDRDDELEEGEVSGDEGDDRPESVPASSLPASLARSAQTSQKDLFARSKATKARGTVETGNHPAVHAVAKTPVDATSTKAPSNGKAAYERRPGAVLADPPPFAGPTPNSTPVGTTANQASTAAKTSGSTDPSEPFTSATPSTSARPNPPVAAASSKGVYVRRAVPSNADPSHPSAGVQPQTKATATALPTKKVKAAYERPAGLMIQPPIPQAYVKPPKVPGALPLSLEEKQERIPTKLHDTFPAEFESPDSVAFSTSFNPPSFSANPSKALAEQPDEKAQWGFWPSPPPLKAGKAVFPAPPPSLLPDEESDATVPPRIDVFIDHSNVFYSFLNWVRARPEAKIVNKVYREPGSAASQQPPNSLAQQKPRTVKVMTIGGKKVKLDYSVLFGLLERGRKVDRRIVVASSPMWQGLEPAVEWGYEVSLLQRVPRTLPPDPKAASASSSVASKKRDKNGNLVTKPPQDKNVKHYKEQAVDELVHLKILESILDYTPSPLPLVTESTSEEEARDPSQAATDGTKPDDANSATESINAGLAVANADKSMSTLDADKATSEEDQVMAPPALNDESGIGGEQGATTENEDDQVGLDDAGKTQESHATANGAKEEPTTSEIGPSTTEQVENEGGSTSGTVGETAADDAKSSSTAVEAPPGPRNRPTLVIATGDANSSEYNPGGFLGCVRRALDRGWDVEIASFSTHGLSSLWAGEKAKRTTSDGRLRGELRIVNLETFAEELVL